MNQRHYAHWPRRLPHSLVYPKTPLFELVETSARRYPDRTAMVFYGTKINYSRYLAEVEKLAGALAGLGVEKGDRVALYLQNTPHFAIGFMGILRANAVVVPLNPMLTGEEAAGLLEDSGARVLITTADLYPKAESACQRAGIEKVIVGNYADYLPEEPELEIPAGMAEPAPLPDGAIGWNDLLASAPAPPPVLVTVDDLALLPFTAGSTGVPKGCRHTHATVLTNVWGSIFWATATPSSVMLAALPFFHVTGLIHGFLAPVAIGGSFVIMTRWSRTTALDAIEKYRVSSWPNITTMVIDLLASPDIDERDLSSLVFVGGGGAPLPAAVGELLQKKTGLVYAEGYGLTETISQTHWNPPDAPRLGSIGIPVFDVDARIVDVAGEEELPVGEQGEIVIHGPQVFEGYWNKPEETEAVFFELDGKRFFRTGDIARMDEDGFFKIVDRKKRMINAAGFKVWPAEVEGILYRHPAVLEACVVGVPDPVRVENVKAFIVKRPGHEAVTAEEIIEWAKGQMAAYKYPRLVQFVDALPKSGAGKIQWRKLQEQERAGK
ncbi:MAG TPA: long-chain fatty acid--CoA ligase [Acidobacteria bacterium]|nr:long-chain fatty acid--CoA ligase [Acidobacteriota bacterium]